MAQKELVLCDTNILIELSKNKTEIIQELRHIGSSNIAVSSITVGEFIFGALNSQELAKIKRALDKVKIIHTDVTVSELAIQLIEKHTLSHHLDVPDAFIAATAIMNNITIYTP